MCKLSLLRLSVPRLQSNSIMLYGFHKIKHHSLNALVHRKSLLVLVYKCVCVCVRMLMCVCTVSVCACGSVLAFEAVHSVELVLFVRKAIEPHGSLCGTAAPTGAGDGISNAAVGQPAGVAAVIAQQLPGSKHLPHFGDMCAVFLTGPDRLIVG